MEEWIGPTTAETKQKHFMCVESKLYRTKVKTTKINLKMHLLPSRKVWTGLFLNHSILIDFKSHYYDFERFTDLR